MNCISRNVYWDHHYLTIHECLYGLRICLAPVALGIEPIVDCYLISSARRKNLEHAMFAVLLEFCVALRRRTR